MNSGTRVSRALSLGVTAALFVSAGAPGDLDPSFGRGGRVLTKAADGAGANVLLLQPDGRILAVGTSIDGAPGGHDVVVVRYTDDGRIDTSFGGGDGMAIASPPGDRATGLAGTLQPDGRILVAGQATSEAAFAVARFLTDGSLDPSFGDQGWTTTPIGTRAEARGVAVQPDGRIVAAGSGTTPTGQRTFAVARYDADGELDHTFGGGDGVARPPVPALVQGASAAAMTLQADGKVLVGGTATTGSGTAVALARFWPDGSLDEAFGDEGWAVLSNGAPARAGAVGLQLDGKILVAGASTVRGRSAFTVIRLLADGTADPTFGAGGWVRAPIGQEDAAANAVLVAPDGRIVAAGEVGGADVDVAVIRLDATGMPDLSFGSGGVVVTSFGSSSDVALALLRQPDGRLVVAGGRLGTDRRIAMARYLG